MVTSSSTGGAMISGKADPNEKTGKAFSIQIRQAGAEDVDDILALVKKSFGNELTDRLIYGCRGFGRYMRDTMEMPEGLAENRYIVATADGILAGFAEILCRPPGLFLNYICTDQDMKIKGVGSSLFSQSLNIVNAEKYETLSLDVFELNARALEWYRKLGFRVMERNRWWDIPLEGTSGRGEAFLSRFPKARACQERFGFSRFQVWTSINSYEVGMLGENWYRVTEPDILQDKEALALLRTLDGKRRLLALLPENHSPAGQVQNALAVSVSLRMTIECTLLQDRLKGK